MARRRVRRQRRLALAALLASAGWLVAVVGSFLSGADGPPRAGSERRAAAPGPSEARASAAPELPRGGRVILPRHRVVAFYGAPQDEELGALGIGAPDRAARLLRWQAGAYGFGGRPVLPALELVATVASASPGGDGSYSYRQSDAVVRRYLAAARRARALLLLDIQPGRADFMREVRHFSRFLAEPDVGLALDPEWRMGPGQVPGRQFGSVDAEAVNEVSAYLAAVVRRRRLPQKLLVVHQFTEDMIRGRERLSEPRGVALVLNVDGFGDRANKLAKYREFTRRHARFRYGFKLFYREDTDLMGPPHVLRLRPRPDLVIYE